MMSKDLFHLKRFYKFMILQSSESMILLCVQLFEMDVHIFISLAFSWPHWSQAGAAGGREAEWLVHEVTQFCETDVYTTSLAKLYLQNQGKKKRKKEKRRPHKKVLLSSRQNNFTNNMSTNIGGCLFSHLHINKYQALTIWKTIRILKLAISSGYFTASDHLWSLSSK